MNDSDEEAEREAMLAAGYRVTDVASDSVTCFQEGFRAGLNHARKQAEPEQRHNGPLDAFSIVAKDRDDWKRRALAAEQRIAALERCAEAARELVEGHETQACRCFACRSIRALDALKDSGGPDGHPSSESGSAADSPGAREPSEPASFTLPVCDCGLITMASAIQAQGEHRADCATQFWRQTLRGGDADARGLPGAQTGRDVASAADSTSAKADSFLTRAELARIARKAQSKFESSTCRAVLQELAEAAESEDDG